MAFSHKKSNDLLRPAQTVYTVYTVLQAFFAGNTGAQTTLISPIIYDLLNGGNAIDDINRHGH